MTHLADEYGRPTVANRVMQFCVWSKHFACDEAGNGGVATQLPRNTSVDTQIQPLIDTANPAIN